MSTEPVQSQSGGDGPAGEPVDAPVAEDAAQLRERLAQAEAKLVAVQRRQALEGALREAGAIDVEAAATLIEALRDVNAQGEPDAAAAVRQLKQRRPYLFGAGAAPSAGSAMSPAPRASPESALERAADEARAGDPNAVLRYMRLRRRCTDQS